MGIASHKMQKKNKKFTDSLIRFLTNDKRFYRHFIVKIIKSLNFEHSVKKTLNLRVQIQLFIFQ